MRINNIELDNNLILAPMAGYTDVAFRSLCKSCGAGLTVTEMVSAKALCYKSEKTEELLVTAKNENIKCVQLFGHEPEIFKEVVKYPVLEKFDIIDLNMGCPAPKIFKNQDGSALLKDTKLIYQIVKACTQNTQKPVTVKFRLGITQDKIVATEVAKICEEAGASLITVHGRTTDMGYSGKCNLEQIQKVKQAVFIPVVCNGDITNKQSFENAKQITNCDGYMIGRGALGNPFIFNEILETNAPFTKKQALLYHYNKLFEVQDELTTILNMRKHLSMYLKGENFDKELRAKLLLSQDKNFILQSIEKYFN